MLPRGGDQDPRRAGRAPRAGGGGRAGDGGVTGAAGDGEGDLGKAEGEEGKRLIVGFVVRTAVGFVSGRWVWKNEGVMCKCGLGKMV